VKIRVGAYLLEPLGMRGNVAGCEPGKGKGRLLARNRRSINTKLVIPRSLLVSWETLI
jgi:hypothetical protein